MHIRQTSIKHYGYVIFLCAQMLLLLWGIVQYAAGVRHLKSYRIPAESLDLITGSYLPGEEAVRIDESAGAAHFLHGPYLTLEKGTYRLSLEYTATESTNVLFLYDSAAAYDTILSDEYILGAHKTVFTTDIRLKRDVPRLECRVIYCGEGELTVKELCLEETRTGYLLRLLNCFGIVLALQLLTALHQWFSSETAAKEDRLAFLGVTAIFLLISYPLFTDYIYDGHDISFHMLRIDGIKDALLSGQFPSRLHPNWFNGAGYATGIYYGELFLYIPALLRILGIPVQECLRFYLLLCNAATCLCTYFCLRKITLKYNAALFGTLLYAAAPYRLTCLYVRAAIGEVSAMTFFPLIVYGMWILLANPQEKGMEEAKEQNRALCWLPLAAGMTGIIQTHMISCIMAAIFLTVTCLVFWKRLIYRKRIWELLKAAGVTILLNAWFLVPFIQYFTGSNRLTQDGAADLQKSGTFLPQLFMIFPQFSIYSKNNYASDGVMGEMPLSIGLSLLLAAALTFYLWYVQKEKTDWRIRLAGYFLILGSCAALFSTHFFPWDSICQRLWIIKKIVSPIQFLWRFLGPAALFFGLAGTLSIGYLLERMKPKASAAYLVIAMTAVFPAIYFGDNVLATGDAYRVYTEEGIPFFEDYMYLPKDADAQSYLDTCEPYGSGQIILGTQSRNGLSMTVPVTNLGAEGYVTIPFVYYEGYKAVAAESGRKLQIMPSENQMVNVCIPEGFEDTLIVSFQGKWYWRVAECISGITAAVMLFLSVRLLLRRRAQKKSPRKEHFT